MTARLVALDEGPDIPLDRTMVVVGRHPQCDARLDSLRVSRHHCCMTQDNDEVVVRDLGSTNGIRINGQRVEMGRLRPGDELSIAHIRFRLEDGQGREATLAEGASQALAARAAAYADDASGSAPTPPSSAEVPLGVMAAADARADVELEEENALAKAVRGLLPAAMADRCRIQVIVQMRDEEDAAEKVNACRPSSSP